MENAVENAALDSEIEFLLLILARRNQPSEGLREHQ
jgi:hypothetical protein